MSTLFFTFVFANLVFLAWLIRYLRKFYGVVEKLDIPVIKPYFIFGSNPFEYKKVSHEVDIQRMHIHGSVYGLYEGRNPQVHINDPELIKLMMVRDYDHFNERERVDFGHPVMNSALDFLPKEQWKVARSQVTQSFTSTRFKHMSDVLKNLSEEHIDDLKNRCEGDRMKLHVREWLGAVETDICGKCFFGIKFQNVKDPKNEITSLFSDLHGEHWSHNFFTYNLPVAFPFLRKLFPVLPKKSVDRLGAITLSMTKQRLKSGNKQNDPADVFASFLSKIESSEYKSLGFSESTIIVVLLEFYFAVYDSTGTAITFLMYYLAKNPDYQDRLIKEVDSVLNKSGGKIAYENINDSEMPYMTACFSEAARLAPGFIRAERICTQDWQHNGIYIPKGFLETTKLLWTHTLFLLLVMNCPGTRWAYQVNKVLLMSLLKEFRFQTRTDTKVSWKTGNGYIPQFSPIYVDIVKRK